MSRTDPQDGDDACECVARLPVERFSYREVGALRTLRFPSGYRVDQHRRQLGRGAACFERAKAALQDWRMFGVGWVRLSPATPALTPGATVGICTRVLGSWFLNVCRIAYVIQETHSGETFGFGLGTTQKHVLSGEERFAVRWDHRDDGVWYEVHAFSRPQHLVGIASYPLVRLMQRRFARDSAAVMTTWVSPA